MDFLISMRTRIFKEKDKYDELMQMLERRRTYMDIARHFHCNHTSVIYWARKIGIPLKEQAEVIIVRRVSPLDDHEHIILKNDRFSDGKSYAAYKQADKERKRRVFILPNGVVL